MRLSEQTWCDVQGTRPVLCVPVGSCEQHGPHLPMATDTIIAEALAALLAARRTDVLVAPPVTVSASGEHAGFAGTLSVGNDVTTATLVELARSADWASGIVLVNGHGGNRVAVDRAVALLRAEQRHIVAWWPRPDLVSGGTDAHAGRTETAMMLALRPDLVHLDRAVVGETAPLAELLPRLRAEGVAAVTPTGVLGDPTGAAAADGRALLDALADDLTDVVTLWLAERMSVS